MADQSQVTTLPVNRRALLAAGVGGALTASAGCTQVRSALGMGMGGCSGNQRSLSPLALGPKNSDVTVTIFADYSCPHCAEFATNVFPSIKKQYITTEKIRYIHRDFPLPVTDFAAPAANAVRSVQKQAGNAPAMRFGKMMYRASQQDNGSLDTIESRAGNIMNTNASRVRSAAKKKPYCEAIKQEKQNGKDRGVEGTPTLFVDGQMLEAPSLNELTSEIDKRLSN